MATTTSRTRYQIVQEALDRAGRGMELRHKAESWLNSLLRSWAFETKFPVLRKFGDAITLSSGAWTADLPSDLGAGIDFLVFGTAKLPKYEKDAEEFLIGGGYPADDAGTGEPGFFMVDRQAGLFRFDRKADQAYSFVPVYYYMPADIATPSSEGDAQKLWFPDDETVIQGLMEIIYGWKEDKREAQQGGKVEAKKATFKRGFNPPAGPANLSLDPRTFRGRRM